MLAKDASEKDISELKKRFKEQQKQRILEKDIKEVLDIVNRRSDKAKRGSTKGSFSFSSDKI